jgi:hypothetical protein
MEMQQRLYRPLPLLDTEGRLIESGYALAPLWEYDPQKVKMPKKTIKEEDTAVFFSDSAIFFVRVGHQGRLHSVSITLADLHRNQIDTATRSHVAFRKQNSNYSISPEKGVTGGFGKMYDITIRTEGQELHAYGHMYDFLGINRPLLFDFVVGLATEPCLQVAMPARGSRGFFCRTFMPGVHADGRVVLGERDILFPSAFSHAAYLWTRAAYRGRIPSASLSSVGMVEGELLSLRLVMGGFRDRLGSENVVFHGGVAHKLGTLSFEEKEEGLILIHDEQKRLQAQFHCSLQAESGEHSLFGKTVLQERYGYLSGEVILDSGKKVVFQSLPSVLFFS